MAASFQTLASIECENALIRHFKKLKIDPEAARMTQDYLHPLSKKIGECIYKTESLSGMKSLIEETKKFQVSDSRRNEAVRVCTAISAFVSLGLDEKQIESKIISFQDGWSEGMRAPLKDLIKSEITSNQVDVNCSPVSSNNSERSTITEKPETNKTPQKKSSDSRSAKQ